MIILFHEHCLLASANEISGVDFRIERVYWLAGIPYAGRGGDTMWRLNQDGTTSKTWYNWHLVASAGRLAAWRNK